MHAPLRRLLPVRLSAVILSVAAVAGPVAPVGIAPVFAADDTVAPVVTAPVVAPVAGEQAGPAGVPLRVAWTAKDPGGSGVVATRLQVSVDGGPWVRVPLAGREARQARYSLLPGHDARFRARAIDAAGNRSPWAANDALRVRLRSESAPGVVLSQGWKVLEERPFLGDRAVRTRQGELSYTFTGSQVAWIGRRSMRAKK